MEVVSTKQASTRVIIDSIHVSSLKAPRGFGCARSPVFGLSAHVALEKMRPSRPNLKQLILWQVPRCFEKSPACPVNVRCEIMESDKFEEKRAGKA